MIKVYNPLQWTTLSEASSLSFQNDKARPVVLEVNAPTKTAIWYVAFDSDGVALDPVFLALVEGRETVHFTSTGRFELTVEGDDVFVYTADGKDWSIKVLEPKIFTQVVERRRRDFDAEYMAYTAQKNIEKRMDQIQKTLEAKYAAELARATGAASPVAPAAAPAASASGTGAADGSGGATGGTENE